MAPFVVIIEIAGQAADRNEAIGTAIIQGDEEAETGHAGDATGEDLTDPIREEGGDIAIGRFPFRRRGPALGAGNMIADIDKLLTHLRRQAILAKTIGADQRAMH